MPLAPTVTCDVLVVGAFAPELAPFREALGDAMRARLGGVRVEARAAGIGVAAASVGAAMHLGEVRPRAVVAVGTCGAYAAAGDGGWSIGEVAVGRRATLVDAAAIAGGAQFPEPMSLVAEASAPMAAAIARASGLREAYVATLLAITVDDAQAARVAGATGAHVEHMESFGIAAACAARGVPWCAVLGVANVVGSRARAEWRLHHREAAARAARAVLVWIEAGAPGLAGVSP